MSAQHCNTFRAETAKNEPSKVVSMEILVLLIQLVVTDAGADVRLKLLAFLELSPEFAVGHDEDFSHIVTPISRLVDGGWEGTNRKIDQSKQYTQPKQYRVGT